MKSSRRNFLKKAALASASAATITGMSSYSGGQKSREELSFRGKEGLIIPKNIGLEITGTFLDEISHDTPHQNWGEAEWDKDFQHMKAIGTDTVIMIRAGYQKLSPTLQNTYWKRVATCLPLIYSTCIYA